MSKEKVAESSKFYEGQMLKIDEMQVDYCYRSMKPFLKGSRALEIGPAHGLMTRNLVNDFEELHILDGASNLLDLIPEYKNVLKIHSMVEDFQPKIKYDCIVMSHVLEHIENPVSVLKLIRSWLGEDGIFIVGVPNAKSIHRLVAVEMGMLKSEYELNERDKLLGHYRVYDEETLKSHLSEAEFKVTDFFGVFLKPLSYGQIEKDWTPEMIEGFYLAGRKLPAYCAEIFAVCKA